MTQTTPAQAMVGELRALGHSLGKPHLLEAADLIESQLLRIAGLESEVRRIERNRDMWKGQCERQAESLSARAGVEGERRAIAAWLRGEAPSDYTDPQYDIGLNLADAVERGDYPNATPSKPGGADREEPFLEGNIRIAIWNGCRARGMGDEASYALIKAVLASLKGEGL